MQKECCSFQTNSRCIYIVPNPNNCHLEAILTGVVPNMCLQNHCKYTDSRTESLNSLFSVSCAKILYINDFYPNVFITGHSVHRVPEPGY